MDLIFNFQNNFDYKRLNYIKFKYICNEIAKCDKNIIFIESFQTINEFFACFDTKDLLPDAFKCFNNLTKLKLKSNSYLSFELLENLNNLKEIEISSIRRIKYLSKTSFKSTVFNLS